MNDIDAMSPANRWQAAAMRATLPRRTRRFDIRGLRHDTVKAVTSWARSAEYFAYDEEANLFTLDNPS